MSAAVVGAGAVSAFGVGWRGLGRAVQERSLRFVVSRDLLDSHPGTLASEVPPIAPEQDAGDARTRKLMSRAARLGAIAQREALRDAGFHEGREEIGAYFGVGASGASMQDVPAILAEGLVEGRLDLRRLGERGIQAVNPLFTFQTLNNFTLCHGAILEGLGGPNAAFFSRGRGTEVALAEAIHALESGECDRALAGAADTALHPVTWAELVRGGFAARGLVPGEGAAALALAREAEHPIAFIEPCSPHERAELTVIAHCLPEPGQDASAVDLRPALGNALAATPALAWTVALDLLRRDAVVLSTDVDGQLSAVRLWRPR